MSNYNLKTKNKFSCFNDSEPSDVEDIKKSQNFMSENEFSKTDTHVKRVKNTNSSNDRSDKGRGGSKSVLKSFDDNVLRRMNRKNSETILEDIESVKEDKVEVNIDKPVVVQKFIKYDDYFNPKNADSKKKNKSVDSDVEEISPRTGRYGSERRRPFHKANNAVKKTVSINTDDFNEFPSLPK